MDQSRSNNPSDAGASTGHIKPPRRSFTMEFWVGLFTMMGVAAAGYLAIGLAGLELSNSNTYEVYAEFDNVSGLKYGAAVEIAGVPIGEVAAIKLQDPMAMLTLKLNKSVRLKDDDVLSIRTKGIIGDRYVKVTRGAGDDVKDGTTMRETESVVDIEDVIGKIVHNLGSDKEESDGSEGEPKTPEAGSKDTDTKAIESK